MCHIYDVNAMTRFAGSFGERGNACRRMSVPPRASLQNEYLHLPYTLLISTADTPPKDARVSMAPSASLPMFSWSS